MKKQFKTQVTKEHYFDKGYDYVNRFISYFYQIDSIKKLKDVNSVLEIGVGNKTVSNYLKTHNYKVTTCDFDRKLKPDIIADIRNLPFNDYKFDVVLCAEVLEHIPLKDLPKALLELSRVSKNYVVVSIPYYCIYFENHFKFSIGYFSRSFDFAIRIPYFFIKPKFSGEHYWGLGIRGISKGQFRKYIKKSGLKVIKEFREFLNPHHYFFVMKKS